MSVQQRGYALIEALENQLKAKRRLEAAKFSHKLVFLDFENETWAEMAQDDRNDERLAMMNSLHAQQSVRHGIESLVWEPARKLYANGLEGNEDWLIYESAYLDNAQWDADAADAAVEIARVAYDMAKEYMRGNE